MKPKAIIVSGYFNPLHKGHLELFKKAKGAGDELFGYCKQRFAKRA
jgi:D-beta-D-heptose 7-phosphate kinase/D-beta-D-heptose 1-phosphate adenosyltransferase